MVVSPWQLHLSASLGMKLNLDSASLRSLSYYVVVFQKCGSGRKGVIHGQGGTRGSPTRRSLRVSLRHHHHRRSIIVESRKKERGTRSGTYIPVPGSDASRASSLRSLT